MAQKRIILVTGANSGIGYDTTKALAASPNNHVILGCRSLERGNRALGEIRSLGLPGTLSLLQIDVADDTSIARATTQLSADFDRVDVLVNNAGVILEKSTNLRQWFLDTYSVNAVGPFILTESLAPLLKNSSDPRIINVTSTLGSMTLRADKSSFSYTVLDEAYRMSKAALNMATVHQQALYGGWGAKFWAFCPGYVITNLTGEGQRQFRVDNGAESSTTSAAGILEIVEGKRDGEVGMFLERNGKRSAW